MTYLQPAIDAALPTLRAEAEARMLSRCTIRRKTGRNEQDEGTGNEYPIWDVLHTATPMRLAARSNASRTLTLPGGTLEVAAREAHLPVAINDLADGDHIEITAGENTGLVLRVIETDWADQKTARRYPVDAVQRPEEWDL